MDRFKKVIDINLNGVTICTKHAVPYMKKAGWGRIVNVSSSQAFLTSETYSAYSASKAAVSHLTRIWGNELADYNILVNAICPCYVMTPMMVGSIARKAAGARYGHRRRLQVFRRPRSDASTSGGRGKSATGRLCFAASLALQRPGATSPLPADRFSFNWRKRGTRIWLKKNSYLVLTSGTSGCKVTLIDTDCNFVGDGYTEYTTYHPNIGWSEQDPADWFPAFMTVSASRWKRAA